MSMLLVSSKGQIVLPAEMRRRLGMGASARIDVLEEPDGLKLRVVRSVAVADIGGMAGLVEAPVRGVPRRLEDFDPALLLTGSRRGKPRGRWPRTSLHGSSSMMPTMHKLPDSARQPSPRWPNDRSCR